MIWINGNDKFKKNFTMARSAEVLVLFQKIGYKYGETIKITSGLCALRNYLLPLKEIK